MPLTPPLLFDAAPAVALAAPAPQSPVPPGPMDPSPVPVPERAPAPRRPVASLLAASPGPPFEDDGRQRGVRLLGEVFARYAHERRGDQPARAFDLPRARLGAEAVLGDWTAARVLIETVRSAAPGSLYGVEGDSIVLRAREIYAEARSPEEGSWGVRLRAGLVPTLAITPLEQMWGRRVIGPTALEAASYASPADLGAEALVRLPLDLGEAAAGVFNGEGFTQHEQNEGKTVQGRLWLTPAARLLPKQASLRLLLHAEDGSVGPTQARADRYVGGLAFEHCAYGAAGAEGAFVEGVAGNSDQRARVVTLWARVGPFRGFEALGRLDQIDPDRRHNGGDDRVTAWQAGVGYHAPTDRGRASELYLTYRHADGGSLARASDPRLPQRGLRVDLRVAF